LSETLAGRVLVVDDETNIGDSIKEALERCGCTVEVADSAEAALLRLERSSPDLVLCDIRLPGMDGIELLGRIRELYPGVPVVMITGYASIESAVRCIQAGAANYLAKPFKPAQVRHAVGSILERKRLHDENVYLRSELRHALGDDAVLGQSPAMQRVFEVAQTVAATDSSVLITGESGTGKEILARFIHSASPRRERAFVTVNCAAIPQNLLESELFGHRRGAFTGAVYGRRGSFEMADRGSLFLDEIGEMPIDMQAKILRALEERRIKLVGSEEPIAVNVRIVAATNKDLEQEIRAGRFREDLFWRLNVVELVLPPLRQRREDVLALARHFLALFSHELKKPIPDFSADVADALLRYDWPGNVRELRNTVERAVIFAEPGKPVRLAHLPPQFRPGAPAEDGAGRSAFRSLRDLEADYIHEVVAACAGNRTRAAEILGISSVTLWRKLSKEVPQP